MDETVDLDAIALATSGAVGSDLANMINEAAINAVKEGREFVSQKDLFAAVEQVLVGKEKKDRIMSKEERRIVSYHEVGHALISALQKNSEPVQKITIVPRTMGALGYVMQVPEEEKYLNTEAELRDMLVGLVGGRAAEELFTGHISTGAMNDLERATKSAYGMIAYAGMSDRLPNICYYNQQEYQFQRPYSETTAKIMDDEVLKMINDEYARAKQILKEHSEGHNQLAELLMTREVIFAEDVERIFGKRPWVSRSEEIIEDNLPKLEDMPEEVRKAQEEHEAAKHKEE